MPTIETVRLPEELIEEAITALKHVLNWQAAPREINFEHVRKTHDDLLKAFRNA